VVVLSIENGIRETNMEREGQRPHRFELRGKVRGAGRRAGADESETLSRQLRPILGDQQVTENAPKIASAPELPVRADFSQKRRSTFEIDVGKVAQRAREVLEEEVTMVETLLSQILVVDGKPRKKLLARVVRLFAGPGYMHLLSMLVHWLVLSKTSFDDKAGFERVDARRFAPALRQYRNNYLLSKLRDLLGTQGNPSSKQFLDAFHVACLYAKVRVGLDLASPVKPMKEELGSCGRSKNRAREMVRFEGGFDTVVKGFMGGELNIFCARLNNYCNRFGALPKGVDFHLSPEVLAGCIPDKQLLPMVAASKIITGNASGLDADAVSNMLDRMRAANDLVKNFQLSDEEVTVSLPELLDSQMPQVLVDLL
jgi:hypothetical protein